jgi:tRNA (guanine-N7-)-methyltransferase
MLIAMSFGLSRGKELDVSGFGYRHDDLPPLPDDMAARPEGAWVDVRAWFDDRSRPFELEIGSGKGTFLTQQASLQPETNFLGIEYAGEFFRYAADRMRRNALTNVRLLQTDASAFVRHRVPSGIVRVLHLYFPDPWPKSRHHKRRMVQDDFMRAAWRVLKPGGELRVVTDHAGYWAWMEAHFARWAVGADAPGPDGAEGPRFERLPFERPPSAREGEVIGTNFERKYIDEGRVFHAAMLRRVEPNDA